MPPQEVISRGKQISAAVEPDISKLHLGPDDQSSRADVSNRNLSQEISLRGYEKTRSSNRNMGKGENDGVESERGKMEKKNSMVKRGSGSSDQSRDKGRDR
ncbi:hypothetical protein ACFE04_003635 [Oxalis oulophora]